MKNDNGRSSKQGEPEVCSNQSGQITRTTSVDALGNCSNSIRKNQTPEAESVRANHSNENRHHSWHSYNEISMKKLLTDKTNALMSGGSLTNRKVSTFSLDMTCSVKIVDDGNETNTAEFVNSNKGVKRQNFQEMTSSNSAAKSETTNHVSHHKHKSITLLGNDKNKDSLTNNGNRSTCAVGSVAVEKSVCSCIFKCCDRLSGICDRRLSPEEQKAAAKRVKQRIEARRRFRKRLQSTQSTVYSGDDDEDSVDESEDNKKVTRRRGRSVGRPSSPLSKSSLCTSSSKTSFTSTDDSSSSESSFIGTSSSSDDSDYDSTSTSVTKRKEKRCRRLKKHKRNHKENSSLSSVSSSCSSCDEDVGDGNKNFLPLSIRCYEVCLQVLKDALFVYETPKVVLIKNKRIGMVFRAVQLFMFTYFVAWVMWWEKGYQYFDESPISGVTTRVGGISWSDMRTPASNLAGGPRIWDDGIYSIPPQQNAGFFVATRISGIVQQKRGFCPETPKLIDARCLNDSHCPRREQAGRLSTSRFGTSLKEEEIDLDVAAHGVFTGRCVKETGTCEVFAWCPIQDDSSESHYITIKKVENSRDSIKNIVVNTNRPALLRINVSNSSPVYFSSKVNSLDNKPGMAGYQTVVVENGRSLPNRENISPEISATSSRIKRDRYFQEENSRNNINKLLQNEPGSVLSFSSVLHGNYSEPSKFSTIGRVPWGKSNVLTSQTYLSQSYNDLKLVSLQRKNKAASHHYINYSLINTNSNSETGYRTPVLSQSKTGLDSQIRTKHAYYAKSKSNLSASRQDVSKSDKGMLLTRIADYYPQTNSRTDAINRTDFSRAKRYKENSHMTDSSEESYARHNYVSEVTTPLMDTESEPHLKSYNFFITDVDMEARHNGVRLIHENVEPLYDALNFTVFIKNAVEFPYYSVNRPNVLRWMTESYLKNCIHQRNHSRDSFCPTFRIGDIIKWSGANVYRILRHGGVIAITIDWRCDLDFDIEECLPKYEFRQLDSEQVVDSWSPLKPGEGWSLESAYHFGGTNEMDNISGGTAGARGTRRLLIRVNGINFVVIVQGKAGKFHMLTFTMNCGSGLALFGSATILIDILLVYIAKDRKIYRKALCDDKALQNQLRLAAQATFAVSRTTGAFGAIGTGNNRFGAGEPKAENANAVKETRKSDELKSVQSEKDLRSPRRHQRFLLINSTEVGLPLEADENNLADDKSDVTHSNNEEATRLWQSEGDKISITNYKESRIIGGGLINSADEDIPDFSDSTTIIERLSTPASMVHLESLDSFELGTSTSTNSGFKKLNYQHKIKNNSIIDGLKNKNSFSCIHNGEENLIQTKPELCRNVEPVNNSREKEIVKAPCKDLNNLSQIDAVIEGKDIFLGRIGDNERRSRKESAKLIQKRKGTPIMAHSNKVVATKMREVDLCRHSLSNISSCNHNNIDSGDHSTGKRKKPSDRLRFMKKGKPGLALMKSLKQGSSTQTGGALAPSGYMLKPVDAKTEQNDSKCAETKERSKFLEVRVNVVDDTEKNAQNVKVIPDNENGVDTNKHFTKNAYYDSKRERKFQKMIKENDREKLNKEITKKGDFSGDSVPNTLPHNSEIYSHTNQYSNAKESIFHTQKTDCDATVYEFLTEHEMTPAPVSFGTLQLVRRMRRVSSSDNMTSSICSYTGRPHKISKHKYDVSGVHGAHDEEEDGERTDDANDDKDHYIDADKDVGHVNKDTNTSPDAVCPSHYCLPIKQPSLPPDQNFGERFDKHAMLCVNDTFNEVLGCADDCDGDSFASETGRLLSVTPYSTSSRTSKSKRRPHSIVSQNSYNQYEPPELSVRISSP